MHLLILASLPVYACRSDHCYFCISLDIVYTAILGSHSRYLRQNWTLEILMDKDIEPVVFGSTNASHCFGDADDAVTHVGGSAAARGYGKGSIGRLQDVHHTGLTGA